MKSFSYKGDFESLLLTDMIWFIEELEAMRVCFLHEHLAMVVGSRQRGEAKGK